MVRDVVLGTKINLQKVVITKEEVTRSQKVQYTTHTVKSDTFQQQHIQAFVEFQTSQSLQQKSENLQGKNLKSFVKVGVAMVTRLLESILKPTGPSQKTMI